MHGTVRLSPGQSLALRVAFSAALFLSAFLLFSVQPMVSRMVLPRLGGSPAVWNTCVCFFQAILLLGYAYADYLALRLRLRVQLGLHCAVLLAALAFMPLSFGAAAPSPDASPVLWLLGHLAARIGPPFFALSATAPLLQHWFSRTRGPGAADPYYLYAASNAGSLLALLLYPFLVERLLGLHDQAMIWSAGFGLCALALLGCGIASISAEQPSSLENRAARAAEPVPAREQWRWVLLAFVPSGLMLAVTTYITTDIAAAPLFWVIPLAIYVLTFVVAFGRRTRTMPAALPILQAIALAAAGIAALMGVPNLFSLGAALAVFTLTAFVCHIELANRRPDAGQLTRYYLLISAGGALGGLFNALVAPVLFRGPWEYPLLLIAACAIRPRRAVQASNGERTARQDWRRLLVVLAGGGLLVWGVSPASPSWVHPYALLLGIALPTIALVWLARGGAFLGVGLAGLLLVPLVVRSFASEHSARSFFGIYRVMQIPEEQLTLLLHGTTIHGVASNKPGEANIPLGYYAPGGPFGRFFVALHTAHPVIPDVDIIGLGTGGLLCYARPGEHWTYREIDPLVEALARDDRYFKFLHVCGYDPHIVLGDARLTLAADTQARYGLLIVDAFSSDSIPLHLLTREALALYFSHLAPGGIVLFHLSNRYLDLVPVVARLAADAGASARHLNLPSPAPGYRYSAAEVVAVSQSAEALAPLAKDGWEVPAPGKVLWTDDRSNIASVIRW